MTGHDATDAARCLEIAGQLATGNPDRAYFAARAQAHATLALVAAVRALGSFLLAVAVILAGISIAVWQR